jgi:hypothetical protein
VEGYMNKGGIYTARGEKEHETGYERGTETFVSGTEPDRNGMGRIERAVSIDMAPGPEYDRIIPSLPIQSYCLPAPTGCGVP